MARTTYHVCGDTPFHGGLCSMVGTCPFLIVGCSEEHRTKDYGMDSNSVLSLSLLCDFEETGSLSGFLSV
jgi:hypothetical protein